MRQCPELGPQALGQSQTPLGLQEPPPYRSCGEKPKMEQRMGLRLEPPLLYPKRGLQPCDRPGRKGAWEGMGWRKPESPDH